TKLRSYSKKGRRSQAEEDVNDIIRENGQLRVMGSYGLLTPEELADEATYTATFGENPYIQNNTKTITNQVCVLTPTFSSDNFTEFAKDIFKKLVENGKETLGKLVADDIDSWQLPNRITRYDVCFMHNYIVEDRKESIKLLFNIHTSSQSYSSSDAEKYFVTFSRENQMLNVTHGEVITINCPHCGGELKFGHTVIQNCPYCGNTVTFAEYDWVLTDVEKVKDSTVITNRAIIKRDTM
ncbi:MAG: hypothetical protein IJL89_01350, partial [Firmicutes bacterium]|nr:hypothetical protein [Bacillota bacterium]